MNKLGGMNKLALNKLALATVFMAACGGMDPQMCGADHCGLQGHTVVKWMFDHYPDWQFTMDSCVDFGVGKVHVEAVGMDGVVHSGDDDCGANQVTFDGLPEGQYAVYVTPRDFAGNDLVTAAAEGSVMAGTFGNNTETTVYTSWDTWIGTFTGTFLFRLSWGGMTCALASFPVATQTLTVMSNGQAVQAVTDNGQRLDGTDPQPCRALDEEFPQSALMLPFGPVTLIVDGFDSGQTMMVHHEFETFVGAGISNPTITYDVPMPMP